MYLYAHKPFDFADFKINFILVRLDLWLGDIVFCNVGMPKTIEHLGGEERDVASIGK